MARRKLKLMISSRCNDKFPASGKGSKALSEIRAAIKKDIEAEKFLDGTLFDVWINEDEPPEPGSQNSWDLCIQQAREADILLSLFNGNAGWRMRKGDIGICHAELMTALSESPGKVSIISLLDDDKKHRPSGPEHERFQSYVDGASLFRGSSVATHEDVVLEAKKAVRESLLNIAHQGAREVKRSRYNLGAALDWTRMDFVSRQSAMRGVIDDALTSRGSRTPDERGTIVEINGKKVLCCSHAIPAAMSIAAAREMVGKPFLKDHLLADVLKKSTFGPLHIVACHKSATENQAIQLLGFPDATIVPGAFGIYIADNIQKIQLCLIANCRDESSTRHGLQKMFDWLGQSGEEVFLAERAVARSNIVHAIAKEANA